MTARARLVEALATVQGLTAHETTPDAPTAGDAWPVWALGRFGGGKLAATLANDYDVLVILPAGYVATTVETADGLMPTIGAALAKVGTLATVEPIAMQVADSSTMPALRFRITPREARQ